MTGRLAGVVFVALLVIGLYALGVRGPAPSRWWRCTSATIGTLACPGSTSAAGTTPAAQRRTR